MVAKSSWKKGGCVAASSPSHSQFIVDRICSQFIVDKCEYNLFKSCAKGNLQPKKGYGS